VKDEANSSTAVAACFKVCTNLASELDAVKKVCVCVRVCVCGGSGLEWRGKARVRYFFLEVGQIFLPNRPLLTWQTLPATSYLTVTSPLQSFCRQQLSHRYLTVTIFLPTTLPANTSNLTPVFFCFSRAGCTGGRRRRAAGVCRGVVTGG